MVPKHEYPIDVLVELIASHDGQSAAGQPEDRVEARLTRSLELAGQAGLSDRRVFLSKEDYGWLCAARGVDRLGSEAAQARVAGIRVFRARRGVSSYILGEVGREELYFPVIEDPSLKTDFVQHVATEDEKRELLETFNAHRLQDAMAAARGQTLQ